MPLTTSGLISIGGSTVGQSVNLELGLTATAASNLNQVNFRTLSGRASGLISLADFYGKSNGVTGVTGNGYWGGGEASFISISDIDGINFSTEAAINPAATLAVARYWLAGVSSSTRGYFGGGSSGVLAAEIDGIIFSTEAAINPAATLAVGRSHPAGVQPYGTISGI